MGLHKMFTLATKYIGCTAIAALALLYVESKDWRNNARPTWTDYSTAVGELRHLVLQDGSQVDLNTGTEIRTRVDADRREVILTRGEARFRVQRSEGAPIFVSAGTAKVKAAGTEFSIRLVNSAQVDVLVEEGRVDISVPAHQARFPDMLASTLSLSVSAGESISLRSNDVYARETLSPPALKRRTAWTDGWIWFSKDPLPEAVAELNRYHREQLVLVDPALARLEIGGRFRSTDLDSFIATLEHSFDVRAGSSAVRETGAATIYLAARCRRAQQQCNWPM
ncbi:MAG: hypothetical protein JWO80_2015, partial [Bryobacterales bacterium]|nr:hypothetical protein [Bryobacterales bacterium]